MWEPDRGQGSKGGQETQEAMEDKEDGGASVFLHQIIDFTPAHFTLTPAPAGSVFNVIHPYSEHPLIRN